MTINKWFAISFCFLIFCGITSAQIRSQQKTFRVQPSVLNTISPESPTDFSRFSVPKREVRAVWLTTIGGIDWPHTYSRSSYTARQQQDELRGILDKLKAAQINTVLIQTRVRGTTIYPSQYEPWDGCMSGIPGRSPGYNALGFVIDECHKRGMEVHAWIVTIPVGKWNKAGCKNLRDRFPNLIKKIGDEGYMNPEDPRTGDYLAKVCQEVTSNYDIDGIHLDYIRYPETWKITVSRNQGRQNITSIVRKIHDAVKSIKPWVKLSCSPIGKYSDLSRYWSHGWNAYDKVCQDAQGWLKSGLMDALFPMMYFRNDQFFPFANDWTEQSQGKIIAPGLGIYFLNTKEGNWDIDDITKEMHHLRAIGAGYTFFRSKFFTDNEQGIYKFTAEDFNHYPSLVPAMTWIDNRRPTAPSNIQVLDNGIRWNAGHCRNNSPNLYYNLYASRNYPVDIEDAHNLVAVHIRNTQLLFNTKGWYFAITSIDRYGNESDALQSKNDDNEKSTINESNKFPTLLSCDGRQLTLPEKPSTMDASIVIIKDMQGHTITSRSYQGAQVYVGNLAEGMYELRSLNRREVSHRLGFFQIKRKDYKSIL